MNAVGSSLLKSSKDRLGQGQSARPRTKSKVSFSMDSIADLLDIKEELPKALMDDNWGNNLDDFGWLGGGDAAGVVDPVAALGDLDNLKQEFPDPLGNLDDLGDLTDLLNSPSSDSNAGSGAGDFASALKSSDFDIFDSNLEIKTDLMLSSTLVDDTIHNNCNGRSKRRRDVSVTLSECAEGFLALKDMELLDNNSTPFGVSPSTFGNGFQSFMDTPMATSESDTETGASTDDDDDDDEEIDVVSEDIGSSRTRVHTPKQHRNHAAAAAAVAVAAAAAANAAPAPAAPAAPVRAGRSLLKARHQKPQQQQYTPSKVAPPAATTTTQQQHPKAIDHFNGDHSYFLARPKPTETETYNDQLDRDMAGEINLLTPSESGEEDGSERLRAMGYDTLTTPAEVDKRKIVAAVQALAQKQGMVRGRNESKHSAANDVKFRFKMRFKSNSPQRAAAAAAVHHHHHASTAVNAAASDRQRSLLIQPRNANHYHPYTPPEQRRVRRKSASKNSYCPAPEAEHTTSPSSVTSSSFSSMQSVLSAPLFAGGQTTTGRSPAVNHYYQEAAATTNEAGIATSSGGKRKSGESRMKSQEEKCREIRDLHNRMERQRRVDLRSNFDQLKACVPSLADNDKPSKLNILNKSADYCRHLVSSETKLKREVERETQRNLMLKKKLAQLVAQADATAATSSRQRMTSSGRLSVIKRFE